MEMKTISPQNMEFNDNSVNQLKMDKMAESKEGVVFRRYGLSMKDKLAYSVGHFLNDLCASMWFTYLLLFLHSVMKVPDVTSGLLLLIGQLADGLSTIFVGLESDRGCFSKWMQKYGKRKSWHLVGTICVICSFPFIFMDIVGMGAHQEVSTAVRFFYYSMFIVIFQFGWAATQISHLSLIPDLSECTDERTSLNAYRFAWTIIANVFVYTVTWVVLSTGTQDEISVLNPNDADKFKKIVLLMVGVGSIFSAIFHIFVKEGDFACCKLVLEIPKSEENSAPPKIWSDWLKMPNFYRVGFLYMATRLFTNISQSFITLYFQETLKLPSESVAYFPFLMFGCGFLASFAAKYITHKAGKKVTFMIGCVFALSASMWLNFGRDHTYKTYLIYVACAFSGIGSSTMLVTALSLVNDLIGNETKSGAFVFGAMSFLDKVSNGTAIMAIQSLHPCLHPCPASGTYYRYVVGYGCSSAVVLCVISLIILLPAKFNRNYLSRNKSSQDVENANKINPGKSSD